MADHKGTVAARVETQLDEILGVLVGHESHAATRSEHRERVAQRLQDVGDLTKQWRCDVFQELRIIPGRFVDAGAPFCGRLSSLLDAVTNAPSDLRDFHYTIPCARSASTS